MNYSNYIKNVLLDVIIPKIVALLVERAFPILKEELLVELPRALGILEKYNTEHFKKALDNYKGTMANNSFTLNNLFTHLRDLKHSDIKKTNFDSLIIGLRYEFELLEDVFKNSTYSKKEEEIILKASIDGILQIVDLMNLVKVRSQKIDQKIFQIGVFANMNAGKSTIINALLGEQLLPSSQYFRTGRLTYINNSTEKTKNATVTTTDNNLFVTFESHELLNEHINKYADFDWFKSAEVYCIDEKGISIRSQILPISNNPFVDIDGHSGVFGYQAKIQITPNRKVYIKNITSIELNGLVNNQYVQSIQIDTEIPFSKENTYTNTQIIDTPGRNPKADTDSTKHHKLIVDTFIPLSDLILYVIDLDVDFIDSSDEAEYLKKLISERKKVDTLFYQNIIFVLNKKDKAENQYGEEVVIRQIEGIKKRIRGYGINVVDEQFITISAESGLLGKRYKQNPDDINVQMALLRYCYPHNAWKEIKKDEYPEALKKAHQRIAESSNIFQLELAIKAKLPKDYLQKLMLDARQVLALFVTYIKNKTNIHNDNKNKTDKELNDEITKMSGLLDFLKKNEEPKIKKFANSILENIREFVNGKFAEHRKNIESAANEAIGKHHAIFNKTWSDEVAAKQAMNAFGTDIFQNVNPKNVSFEYVFLRELKVKHQYQYKKLFEEEEEFIGKRGVLTFEGLRLAGLGINSINYNISRSTSHSYTHFLWLVKWNHSYTHTYSISSSEADSIKRSVLANIDTVRNAIINSLAEDKAKQERDIISGLHSYISLKQNMLNQLKEDLSYNKKQNKEVSDRLKQREKDIEDTQRELDDIEKDISNKKNDIHEE